MLYNSRMLCRRVFLQAAAAGLGLARSSQQKSNVTVSSASRDETARVAIVLSSYAGSSDHDGTKVKGLAEPQPVTKELTDAQIDAMVRKVLDLDNGRGGGLSGIVEADDWVVIKPDISACYGTANRYVPGAVTDLRVVRSIIGYLVEHKRGARITVAEGSDEWQVKERSKADTDGWTTDWGGAFGCLSYRGMIAEFAKQQPGVQFECTDLNFDATVESPAPANQTRTYHVPKTIQQCDKLISVAPLKTDRRTGVSLTIMNYLGIAPGAQYGFPKTKLAEIGPPEEVAVDLYSFHPADYAVVGGCFGIEGDGESVHHNVVIAGAAATAVDAVGAAVMGFDPAKIGYLHRAERKGFGGSDTDVVWIRGNEIEEARRSFRKPSA